MSDELTRAIAEELGCERDEFIDQEGGRRPFCNEHGFIATGWPCPQAEDVAAAITTLIEARVREARADELEKFAAALDGQFPDRSGSLMGRLVNPSIRQVAEAARIWAEEVRRG